MTGLLDIVKETDLRLNFTAALKSPTAYETLDRATLQPRLLLCLHGLGTNVGLQRMAGRHSGLTDMVYEPVWSLCGSVQANHFGEGRCLPHYSECC